MGGTWGGPSLHRNYCIVLDAPRAVTGPEKNSLHEVVLDGMKDIGEPAGDRYHAWVDVEELLARKDLMLGCRVPLQHFVQNAFGGVLDVTAPVAAAEAAPEPEDEPALKKP